MRTTVDDAASASFDDIGGLASYFKLHPTCFWWQQSRHVRSIALELMEVTTALNSAFHHSPQSTRKLQEAQAGTIDIGTGKAAVSLDCLGVAGIPWTCEEYLPHLLAYRRHK
jgi:hypothetical protein